MEVRELVEKGGEGGGVVALYKGGVVHGDLTSSNLMVRPVMGKLEEGLLGGRVTDAENGWGDCVD